MKKTKQKQNTFIQMFLVCFLMGAASAKSQTISNINNHNYKHVIETKGIGDNYEQKKKNFISQNPDTYQSMSGEKINVNQKLKTQAEKDALKKMRIKNLLN